MSKSQIHNHNARAASSRVPSSLFGLLVLFLLLARSTCCHTNKGRSVVSGFSRDIVWTPYAIYKSTRGVCS